MSFRELFNERNARINAAIALKEADRVPVVPMVSSLPFYLSGYATFQDTMYNYPRAGKAILEFYEKYQPDGVNFNGMRSGKANEIAGSTMFDWPGRRGSIVDPRSTYQAIEHEYMLREEYPELLSDFTGFMLRKYIPRAFPELMGLKGIKFVTSSVLGTACLSDLCSSPVLDTFDKLRKIGEYDREAAAFNAQLSLKLGEMGFPPMSTGKGQAPFDILGDYFRGTVAMFEDQIECPDLIEEACYMFADMEIEAFQQQFKDSRSPVKRVFFPMHKGMDGFMSPDQYRELYWKPFRKVIDALVEMDVVPILYGEGPYNTRLEQMTDIPAGKTVIHFERVDMAKAKKVLGDKACISGNFPIALLERGTVKQVSDEVKRLTDIMAPGGGWIFDTDACIGDGKPENVEAMFDTIFTYGKY